MRGKEGGGEGREVQGPVGRREDLALYPEGGGSPGGLWAGEEPDLTQVLRCWSVLQGEQAGERRGQDPSRVLTCAFWWLQGG